MRGLGWIICSASILGSALAGPASAVVRDFPPDARHAVFSVVQYPTVKLSRKTLQLAPGAQIRDTNNMIVQPQLLPDRYRVLYTLDGDGNVNRVWILTPEEQAQYGPKMWLVPW
jgi:hypothetical protein